MKEQAVGNAARMRLKLAGASALMLLLAACGDHPPKDDDDDTPPPVQAAISIVAGSATESGSRDATGATARFNSPRGITIDSAGNLYVADQGNRTIRRITPGGVVTTFAGAAGMQEFVDAVGGSARFVDPAAIAIDNNGTLYVADNLRIRSVGAAGQVNTITTLPVGTNVSNASLPTVTPGGIAADARGNLYVTNGYGTRRIALGTTVTTMLEGANVVNNLTGTRTFTPRGVAVDGSNNVYVADLEKTVSKTNGSTSLTRLAGAANITGSTDGTGSAASFEQVVALTVDQQGNLYAADAVNNLVRKITPAGLVTKVAGSLRENALRTGPLPGSLANIAGITTDGKGTLYATSGNAVIKIVVP
ncbi:MAG: hypothetical protein ACREWI_03465 [Telluria sp.]